MRVMGIEAIYQKPTPVADTRNTRSIRTCCEEWRSSSRIKCGARISLISPWPRGYGIHRFDSVIDIFCALRQESVGKIL
jgi:hypothetical protein